MNNRFMNMIRHTRVFGHVEDMIVQTHVVPRKSHDLQSINEACFGHHDLL